MSAEVLLLTLSLVGAPVVQVVAPTSGGTSPATSRTLPERSSESGGAPGPVASETNGTEEAPGGVAGETRDVPEPVASETNGTEGAPGGVARETRDLPEASSGAPANIAAHPTRGADEAQPGDPEEDAAAHARPTQVGRTATAAHPVAPASLVPESEVAGAEGREADLLPHASVVPSRAFPVRMAGMGITLVGLASYIGGQLVMDAADRMPRGLERKERFDFGLSIRGGGLGAVITGVSIWLISEELARWEDGPPATVGFVPVRDGGAVTFSMGLP